MRAKIAVYAAAGVSSRFGGEMKSLTKVGPNDETLLELSFNQAQAAGIERIILIVSDKTKEPLEDAFGEEYDGMSITYCMQKTPSYREKPLGTSHALLSAKGAVDGPFIFLNADDLYGADAISRVTEYMSTQNDAYCIAGYKLRNVLNEKGTVNRGLISVDDDKLISIEELFDIGVSDIPSRFSGDELMNMNLFGFQAEFLEFVEEDFESFMKEHGKDPRVEFLVGDTISRFLVQQKHKMTVIPVDDLWCGITYQEDVAVMREKLAQESL